MFGFLKRLFRIGAAEAHSALDKLENPIKMTEQSLRELKTDLDKSLQSLAEVKAIAIRTGREVETHKQTADDYEKKAMALLKRGQSGQVAPAEAERLATEALARREDSLKLYTTSVQNKQKYDAMVTNLESKIQQLKSQISKWESELKTMKARNTVSQATTKINKQLANIDSSGTLAQLEKMRERIEQQEALAEAYGDMANIEKSVDSEIDKILDSRTLNAESSLEEMKRKMGILPQEQKTPISIKENQEVTIKIELDKNNNAGN
jgi:phage shock protein A